jgi:hypothetical protein
MVDWRLVGWLDGGLEAGGMLGWWTGGLWDAWMVDWRLVGWTAGGQRLMGWSSVQLVVCSQLVGWLACVLGGWSDGGLLGFNVG